MTATKTRLYFSLKVFLWSSPPAFVSYIRLLFICFFSAALSFHLARSAAWELNCGTCFAVLEKKIVCTRLWTRSASFFFPRNEDQKEQLACGKTKLHKLSGSRTSLLFYSYFLLRLVFGPNGVYDIGKKEITILKTRLRLRHQKN